MTNRAEQSWPEDETVEILEPSLSDALDYAVEVELFASVFEPIHVVMQ